MTGQTPTDNALGREQLDEIRSRDKWPHTHTQATRDRGALLAEVDRLNALTESWANRCETAWTERDQLQSRLTNPCNGNDCEDGGAIHCHRCPEAEADATLRRAVAAETQLAGYADKLNAIATLVDDSGPQCVNRPALDAILDAILGTTPQDGPQPHAERIAHQFESDGMPDPANGPQRGTGDVEPPLHYTVNGGASVCGQTAHLTRGTEFRLAFDPSDDRIDCPSCRMFLKGARDGVGAKP